MHIVQVFAGEDQGVVTIMSGQVGVKVTPYTKTTVRM